MIDTVTFTSECGKFEFTVMDTFVKRKCSLLGDNGKYHMETIVDMEVTKESVYSLMNDHHMKNYLHSEKKPAIVYLESKHVAYFKNGEPLSLEDGKKMQFNSEFSDHVILDLGL